MLRTVCLKSKTETFNWAEDVECYFALVPWTLWDLFSSKIPYARGIGEEGFQALSAMGTMMIWVRSKALMAWGPMISSDSSVSTSGNRGRKCFLFFSTTRKQKSQWALSWILAQEISVHLPSETQVSGVGTLQRPRRDAVHAEKLVAMCFTVATTIHEGKADAPGLSAIIPPESLLLFQGYLSGYPQGQFLQLS